MSGTLWVWGCRVLPLAAVFAAAPAAAQDDVGDPGFSSYDMPSYDAEAVRRERELIGVRGFGGLLFGGGLTLHAYDVGGRLKGPDTFGAMLFALRGGVMFDKAEASLEYAPFTFWPILSGDNPRLDAGENMHAFLANFGFHIPVARQVYWPLRIGAGFASDRTEFMGRVDLFAISIKTKYILIDVMLPSIRYMSDFGDYHRWTGVFAIGGSYISP